MSQQNSATPRDFLLAVENKYDVVFTFDIACTTLDNVVRSLHPEDRGEVIDSKSCGYHFDLGQDALAEDWSKIEAPVSFLNPQWKKTKLFARKCAEGTGRWVDETFGLYAPGTRIISLFPAGVGSQWFSDYVLGHTGLTFLSPRLTYTDPRTGLPFVSKKTGKPQTGLNDALLIDWDPPEGPYTRCWNWRDHLADMQVEAARKEDEVNAAKMYHVAGVSV